ncbi:HAD hydrolase-like protein [Parazoarcus communis]|nr:HAD hydrolase-like protein [Parazoarcus communis]NMG68706.1 HAD hydrolase-like protein [Parazoarcus communis SWub3 = DSM 12120]
MKIEKPLTGDFTAHLSSPNTSNGGIPLTSSIRALIFDLDGTLVDTLGGVVNAINCALMCRGLAPLTISEVADRVGEGGTALVEYALKNAGHEGDSQKDTQLQESYFQAYLSAK